MISTSPITLFVQTQRCSGLRVLFGGLVSALGKEEWKTHELFQVIGPKRIFSHGSTYYGELASFRWALWLIYRTLFQDYCSSSLLGSLHLSDTTLLPWNGLTVGFATSSKCFQNASTLCLILRSFPVVFTGTGVRLYFFPRSILCVYSFFLVASPSCDGYQLRTMGHRWIHLPVLGSPKELFMVVEVQLCPFRSVSFFLVLAHLLT